MNIKTKTLCLIFSLLNTFAFSQGVKFEPMNINDAMAKAKQENKIIFIHNGESCSWGNFSKKTLEASDIAGPFFNKNFINVIPLNKYEIDAIFSTADAPRYFFIKPDGNIVMMVSMYHKPKKLVKLGKKVLKGKIIKPNIGMYTDKMYPTNKNTLKMLSYTMQAHMMFNFSTDIDYDDIDYNLMDNFNISDLENCKSTLQESFKYGRYYYNQFLLVLIYETIGEKEKSKKLAKEILDKYPHKEFYKNRTLTDNFLMKIIAG